MNKQSLTSAALGIILMAGLVACKKMDQSANSKTVTDVYEPPAPQILQTEGPTAAEVFLLSAADLDLNDVIDVRTAQPKSTRVKGSCLNNGITSPFDQTFSNSETLIPFSQILPDPLLYVSSKPDQTKAVCAFTVTLTNAIGSKRVFTVENKIYKDAQSPLVRIEGNDSGQIVHADQLANLQFRYRSPGPAVAQIKCEQLDLPDIPFDQVLEMSKFDVRSQQFKAPATPSNFKPIQNCRLQVRQSGRTVALSALFRMAFGFKDPLQVAEVPINWQAYPLLLNLMRDSIETKQVDLFNFTIHNPSSQTRYFKLPKDAVLMTMDFYLNDQTVKLVKPYLLLRLNDPSMMVAEDASSQTVRLDPGASALLHLHYGVRRITCQTMNLDYLSLGMSTNQALHFTEVDESGEPLSALNYKPTLNLFLHNQGVTEAWARKQPVPVNENLCSWQ